MSISKIIAEIYDEFCEFIIAHFLPLFPCMEREEAPCFVEIPNEIEPIYKFNSAVYELGAGYTRQDYQTLNQGEFVPDKYQSDDEYELV